jgi:hypothetical protein
MDKRLLFIVVPFFLIFIITGGWMMFSTGYKILLGIQARHWPQATGRILSVQSKNTSDSETSSREIQVRYTYSVGGRQYESGTIHPAYGDSSFEDAHRGLDSLLRSAQQVRVYYDASQPSRSTLSVGFYSSSLASFFVGFLFLVAGVAFLLTCVFAIAGNQDFAGGIAVIQ